MLVQGQTHLAEILFRATSHGMGTRNPGIPSQHPDYRETVNSPTERERKGPQGAPQLPQNSNGPHQRSRCHENIRTHALVSSAFPDPKDFVSSGNRIVFSSKSELITDAACANNDNLLCSKITSRSPDRWLKEWRLGRNRKDKRLRKEFLMRNCFNKGFDLHIELDDLNHEVVEELDTYY